MSLVVRPNNPPPLEGSIDRLRPIQQKISLSPANEKIVAALAQRLVANSIVHSPKQSFLPARVLSAREIKPESVQRLFAPTNHDLDEITISPSLTDLGLALTRPILRKAPVAIFASTSPDGQAALAGLQMFFDHLGVASTSFSINQKLTPARASDIVSALHQQNCNHALLTDQEAATAQLQQSLNEKSFLVGQLKETGSSLSASASMYLLARSMSGLFDLCARSPEYIYKRLLCLAAVGAICGDEDLLSTNRMIAAAGLRQSALGNIDPFPLGLKVLEALHNLSAQDRAVNLRPRLAPCLSAAERLSPAFVSEVLEALEKPQALKPSAESNLAVNRAVLRLSRDSRTPYFRLGISALKEELQSTKSTSGSLSHLTSELLHGTENERCESVAAALMVLKRINQGIEQSGLKLIEELLPLQKALDPALVFTHSNFHSSAADLLAAEAAKRFSRPTVVLRAQDDGSHCGALHSFNLDFSEIDDALPGVSQMPKAGQTAAVELSPGELETFSTGLKKLAAKLQGSNIPQTQVMADLEINRSELTTENLRSLQNLAPFGPGFPEPTLLLRRQRTIQVERHSKFTPHLRVKLSDGTHPYNTYSWNTTNHPSLWPGALVDVALSPGHLIYPTQLRPPLNIVGARLSEDPAVARRPPTPTVFPAQIDLSLPVHSFVPELKFSGPIDKFACLSFSLVPARKPTLPEDRASATSPSGIELLAAKTLLEEANKAISWQHLLLDPYPVLQLQFDKGLRREHRSDSAGLPRELWLKNFAEHVAETTGNQGLAYPTRVLELITSQYNALCCLSLSEYLGSAERRQHKNLPLEFFPPAALKQDQDLPKQLTASINLRAVYNLLAGAKRQSGRSPDLPTKLRVLKTFLSEHCQSDHDRVMIYTATASHSRELGSLLATGALGRPLANSLHIGTARAAIKARLKAVNDFNAGKSTILILNSGPEPEAIKAPVKAILYFLPPSLKKKPAITMALPQAEAPKELTLCSVYGSDVPRFFALQ